MQWTKRLLPVMAATALLATSAFPTAAQDSDEDVVDLQTRVDEFVGLVDGGAAAVTIRDGVVSMAATGIANAEGDPMTVDTPMLVGGASVSMIYGLALQLVDEGLIDLDAPVVDYLPDAPVGEGATVRDLLSSRHGAPQVLSAVFDLSIEDPDRTWTTDEMVELADRSEITPVGEFTPGYAGTLVTIQLIEAVSGSELGTALEERITGPLGLEATVHPGDDIERPNLTAGGWPSLDGQSLTYVTDEWESIRSLRPTVSSAVDLATFLSAYLDGQVVSPELLDETAWNEGVETMAYGFLRPDELFPTAGPLGAPYFGISQFEEAGVTHAIVGSPSSGDVVVVLANSWALDTSDLAEDIVQSWAPDPLTNGPLSDAEATFRFVTGTFTCDLGQPSPFDLPPCEIGEVEATLPFELPFELSGTFDGSGMYTGVWLQNLEDGTFTYTGQALFMGEVEGCGYGTLYLAIDDGAGFEGEDGLNYTAGTMTVLPGGTLPLAGTLEMTGIQTEYPDGTGTVPISGSYTCTP